MSDSGPGPRPSTGRLVGWGNFKDEETMRMYQMAVDAVQSLENLCFSTCSDNGAQDSPTWPTDSEVNGVAAYANEQGCRESPDRDSALTCSRPGSANLSWDAEGQTVSKALSSEDMFGSLESPALVFANSNGSIPNASRLRRTELLREKAFLERVLEQQENLSEQKRLQDINQMCEKLQIVEVKPQPKSSRIKTNGSLPRDRLDASPGGNPSSADDLRNKDALHASPTFATQATISPSIYTDGAPGRDSSLLSSVPAGAPDSPVPVPVGPVGPASPSHPLLPLSVPGSPGSPTRSPRRGIKTVLSKEVFSFPQEITDEVVEKNLGLPEERKQQNKSKPMTSTPRPTQNYSRTLPNPKRDARKDVAGLADSPLSLELEFVRKERMKILSGTTVLKSQLNEIDVHLQELDRSMAMEYALTKAELGSVTEKVRHQQDRIASLQERADKCQREIELWQENRNKQQLVFSMSLENAEMDLSHLRSDLENCKDDKVLAELKEKIYHQMDVVDSEKKLYEDLEFKYLEEESVWLAKKEEVNKELSEAMHKYQECSADVALLEAALAALRNPANLSDREGELAQQAQQRDAYLQRLREGQAHLDALDVRIMELVSQGAEILSPMSVGDLTEIGLRDAPSIGDLDSTASDLFANGLSSMESSFCSQSLPAGAEAAGFMSPPNDVNARGYFPSDLPSAREMEEERTFPDAAGRQRHASFDKVTLKHPDGPTVPTGRTNNVSLVPPRPPGRRPNGSSNLPVPGLAGRGLHRRSNDRQQRPLTRYLPVRGGDLDLRQHIESAGHSVDLCSHVTVDSTSCRGPLLKASARFGNWQKRWFLFDRSSRLLTYCKNRRERRPRGGVHFQSISEVYVDHMSGHKHGQPNCVFVVKTTERSYHLMAPSPEAMRIWVDVIFTGAEAYQEFS